MKPARQFDGNYIMSLSKAAPNLEELELMGTSGDTLASLLFFCTPYILIRINSMQDSPPRYLGSQSYSASLSGGINSYNKPFFARSPNWEEYAEFNTGGVAENYCGKYAPETFDEAARDLANGCRTLDVVTMGNIFGELSIKDGLSRKVVRECNRGTIKELKKTKALGNIIGREDEW